MLIPIFPPPIRLVDEYFLSGFLEFYQPVFFFVEVCLTLQIPGGVDNLR